MTQIVEVAAAVVFNDSRTHVLIAQRHPDAHQGGKWEFPGGKRESGESLLQTLCRELAEELAITPLHYRPFIRLAYQYPDKSVVLHVWLVDSFTGYPASLEGQAIRWAAIEDLDPIVFPAANRGIIQALRLPELCLVTPAAGALPADSFLAGIKTALQRGIRLLQLRSHELQPEAYLALAAQAAALCAEYDAKLLLNMPPEHWVDGMAAGLHLSGRQLAQITSKPQIQGWLSASCHNELELEHAQHLGVDFVFISPVRETGSHPGRPALGWQGLDRLLRICRVPVYVLGGMHSKDLALARYLGAFGVAGITAFWN
jgi:8-oxo-dGTP diphosphatase